MTVENSTKACSVQNSSILLSILIPIYNNFEYIHECIDSVLQQTMQNFELILINDGSTDFRVLNSLSQYAKNDERIILINKENSGYGHSMNIGLDKARGKYIGIVESDDYILPEMFATLYSIAEKHNLDFVKCNHSKFNGEGTEKTFADESLLEKDSLLYDQVIDIQEHLELMKISCYVWNGIYKKDFITQHSIRFNETAGASYQDNGFWFQTFMFSKKMYFIKDIFYMLRRDNPTSSINSNEKVFCICDEYAFIRNILAKHPQLENIFLKSFYARKMNSYRFTLRRVANKFQKSFFARFYDEFLSSYNANAFSKENTEEKLYNEIMYLLAEPQAYFIRRVTIDKGDKTYLTKMKYKFLARNIKCKLKLHKLHGELAA